jgi:hypothetical protein
MHRFQFMKRSKLLAYFSMLFAAWAAQGATETPPAHTDTGTSSTVSGEISGYTTSPRGELDGFTLDTGATVHFPPHTGAQLKPLLKSGQSVVVTGTIQEGPSGRVVEAGSVKNLNNGQSVNVAAIPAPPREPPTPGAVSPPGEAPQG